MRYGTRFAVYIAVLARAASSRRSVGKYERDGRIGR